MRWITCVLYVFCPLAGLIRERDNTADDQAEFPDLPISLRYPDPSRNRERYDEVVVLSGFLWHDEQPIQQ